MTASFGTLGIKTFRTTLPHDISFNRIKRSSILVGVVSGNQDANYLVLVNQQKLKYQDSPNLAMVIIVEMDETITLDKQLEENIGPVILINKINLDPEDVNQFLKAWASVIFNLLQL